MKDKNTLLTEKLVNDKKFLKDFLRDKIIVLYSLIFLLKNQERDKKDYGRIRKIRN